MAKPTVGTGLDELVIFAKGRCVAPLFAEATRCDPDQRNRGRSQNHGCDEGRRRFMKADGANIRPYQGEADHDQQNAPLRSRGSGDLFAIGRLLAGFYEGQRPQNPAEEEFGEGDPLEHGRNYKRLHK